ncbi:MAG: futalosine hydrolase [Chitinophagales bacterium]|nr:futalosine hydrolase [Chitinophagales bacterium]
MTKLPVHILFVVASKIEVKPMLNLGMFKQVTADVYVAESNGKAIHLLVAGMGMLVTAAKLSYYLEQHQPEWVVDIGIAGAFNRNLCIGEVVNVTSETYGDFGVEDDDDFKDFFDLGFIETKEDAFTYGLQKATPCAYIFPLVHELKQVNSLTVNKVHGKEHSIQRLMNKYNADIENMEGLAVFYVCALRNLPCIEIRSISNYVEKRNKENWDINTAVERLNEFIIQNFKL